MIYVLVESGLTMLALTCIGRVEAVSCDIPNLLLGRGHSSCDILKLRSERRSESDIGHYRRQKLIPALFHPPTFSEGTNPCCNVATANP